MVVACRVFHVTVIVVGAVCCQQNTSICIWCGNAAECNRCIINVAGDKLGTTQPCIIRFLLSLITRYSHGGWGLLTQGGGYNVEL